MPKRNVPNRGPWISSVTNFVPLGIAGVDAIVRFSDGHWVWVDFGTTLAAIGVGLILPFIVFDNLLLGKFFALSSSAKSMGSTGIRVDYYVQHRDAGDLPKIRQRAQAAAIGSVLAWVAAMNLTYGSHPNKVGAIVFGVGTFLTAYAFLLFG